MNHYGARFVFRSGDNPGRNTLLVLKDVATNSVLVPFENLIHFGLYVVYFIRNSYIRMSSYRSIEEKNCTFIVYRRV